MNSLFTFVPGTSWLHRRSPVAKLAWFAAAVGIAFATYHPVPLAVVAVTGLALAALSGVARPALRTMAVLGPLAASIIVLQALAPATCASPCLVVAQVGPFAIGGAGLTRGLSLVLRVLAMETWAVAVLVTTHPSDLFAGLRRLHVPYTAAFMGSLTVQLVPVLGRELEIVLAAQRARGMSARGFGALIPALRPAFVATFERVQGMAISMEARGFGLAGARTSWRYVGLDRVDQVLAILGAVALVAGVGAGIAWWGLDSLPVVVWPAAVAVVVTAVSAAAFGWLLVRALVLTARG